MTIGDDSYICPLPPEQPLRDVLGEVAGAVEVRREQQLVARDKAPGGPPAELLLDRSSGRPKKRKPMPRSSRAVEPSMRLGKTSSRRSRTSDAAHVLSRYPRFCVVIKDGCFWLWAA